MSFGDDSDEDIMEELEASRESRWTNQCLTISLFKTLVEKNVISRDDLREIFEDAKAPMPGETRHSEYLDGLLQTIFARLES